MRNAQSALLVVVSLLAGALVTREFSREAGAQDQAYTEAQAWEIYHGRYNNPANDQDDARFYVVRHNRLTGDTQYIGCEDRDGCTLLKLEIQD